MMHVVMKSSDKKEIKKTAKLAKKSAYKSVLIQIFTASDKEKEIEKTVQNLSVNFPNAVIIGATTAGEIAHAKMCESSTVISVSLFKKTKLTLAYTKKTTEKAGKKLAKKIVSSDTKAVIVLSEGLRGEDYEGFIRGFGKDNPNLIIAGGLAGDNFKLKKTFVFSNKAIYTKGSVAVSFSSKSLYADNRYNLNWTPIGKEFTITKAEGNIVYEIDNQKSIEVFKKYLGEDVFKEEAKALPDFQLLYKEGKTVVSRTPMMLQNSSLVFAAPLKEGQKVQFGFSNASSVLEGSSTIKEKIMQNPAEAIFVYSCIARKTLLGKVLEKEFQNFETIAPTAGFFTYGEYYSTGADNALLNCTTTLLVLSESKKRKSIDIEEPQYNFENITFNALTHFIKQTSNELSLNGKLLGQYKDAVDASLLVSKTDTAGVITYVNENFCRVSKYSREELIGKSHNIVRDKSVSSFLFKKMWNRIQGGRVYKGEFPNRAKDGSVYYVSATIMPTYNDYGDIDGYIAVREDITKQVIAKKKMKEKEKFIKAIFDNQESIVIFSSKSKGMLYVNQALYTYFDYKSFEDFKTKHKCICELFLDEEGYIHPEKEQDWIATVLNNPQTVHKVKMLTKDSIVHTFNIKIKNIGDEYITNLTDITDLETALQKAYASEQAKSVFLANMSHEIRTPLNGILGFTEVLRKKELENESKKYVDIIHRSGKTLLSVVNDILDFSKMESGELTLYETNANLFKEMEATVSVFASTSREKQIEYYAYIDTNIPKELLCDVQRIKQVMNNLTSNAIKFTPAGGEVRVNISLIEIKNKKAKIHFSVKDSGIGIAEDKLSTIFEPFSQADNSISRKFGGTGLGLSISSDFIKMMGSKLHVKSEKDVGSEFYFDLSLSVADADNSLDKPLSMQESKIALMHAKGNIICGINDIVTAYLQGWNCQYKSINALSELDITVDILIVCAKLFDKESCMQALNKFEKLHLIYIEGGDKSFNCSHEKFHLIEQPMTGSDLFDQIITLTHVKDEKEKRVEVLPKTREYAGHVLIAEDNETNQMLISLMLDERKISHTLVANGQEAVEEALKKSYDLIFMDINMPVLDGVSATKLLRQKGYKKPIVSLSANVIEADKKAFLAAGVNDTLNKPIVSSELDTVLERYLQETDKELEIIFDAIDVDSLATALALPNRDIVVKLLHSFRDSARVMLERIESEGLNKEILHSLKGMSGNLRFEKLFRLVKEYEEQIEQWSDKQKTENAAIVKAHLGHVIKSII